MLEKVIDDYSLADIPTLFCQNGASCHIWLHDLHNLPQAHLLEVH